MKSKDIIKIETKDKINNLEFVNDYILVYFPEKFYIFDLQGELLTKTIIPNIKSFFKIKNQNFYISDSQILLYKEKGQPILKKIKNYNLCKEKYLFLFYEDHCELYKRNKGLVHSFNLTKEQIEATNLQGFVRKRKIYILYNNKIEGHDLNIYTDTINKFKVSNFFNLKGELILFDEENKKIRIYQKNLEKLLFEEYCDSFVYNPKFKRLFITSNKNFRAFKKINEYKKKFELIDQSTVYKEQEDEFDESDSSFKDF